MNPRFKRNAIAMLLAPALALPAGALYAQDRQQSQYRNTWSAEEMIDTDVRGQNGEQIGEVKDIIVGEDGNIRKVVVEVGGFLEIGDQHIGVPWKDVTIGQEMQSVQVPLREVENGTYSLFGKVPEGEDVAAAGNAWRVNELIGDYASLEDVPRYGMVTDVIFNDQGKAQTVIVDRRMGAWGEAGWYGYPYAGYPGAYAYPLPYRSTGVATLDAFDYAQLAEQSQYASEQREPRQRQARSRNSGEGGSAAGSTAQQDRQQNQSR
jgi:sporulation protein YlmC with PRC-barrel domain